MTNCEMYDVKKAFEYKGCVVCEIGRGGCPYNNEGHLIKGKDGKIMVICKTSGRVDSREKGLLKNLTQQQDQFSV